MGLEPMNKENEDSLNMLSIVSYGLIAVSIATIFSMIGLETLTTSLRFSLYSHLVAIPFLVSTGVLTHPNSDSSIFPKDKSEIAVSILLIAGTVLSVAGFVALAFHFGRSFGWVFIGSILICWIVLTVLVWPIARRST